MNMPFTPRNVVKYVVKTAVYLKATSLLEDAMVDYTRFEEDDIIVKIAPKVAAWYISDKLQPVTDKAVDLTADFIVDQREARKANKNKTEE